MKQTFDASYNQGKAASIRHKMSHSYADRSYLLHYYNYYIVNFLLKAAHNRTVFS